MATARGGWSKAYHWHLDRDLTIEEAMQLRYSNDPRAGDIHCHKSCFTQGVGDQLLTRKKSYDGSRAAHFARWPSSYSQGEEDE